jgi:serine/threonine protein kinase
MYQKGDRIANRFEVVREISSGGQAVVYEVRDLDAPEPTPLYRAIKVPGPEQRDVALARMAREFRIADALRNDSQLLITGGLGWVREVPAMVMDYHREDNLRTFRKDCGDRVDPTLSLQLAYAAAKNVARIHRKGVIHRDLTPSNLLVHEEEGHYSIRVIDFGIAKRVTGDQDEVRLTSSGGRLGTRGYAAPEQWLDAQSADARADTFTLAIVLYELLEGERPYPDEYWPTSPRTWGPHHPPRNLTTELPDVARQAILRALSPDSEERPTMGEFASLIGEALLLLGARSTVEDSATPGRRSLDGTSRDSRAMSAGGQPIRLHAPLVTSSHSRIELPEQAGEPDANPPHWPARSAAEKVDADEGSRVDRRSHVDQSPIGRSRRGDVLIAIALVFVVLTIPTGVWLLGWYADGVKIPPQVAGGREIQVPTQPGAPSTHEAPKVQPTEPPSGPDPSAAARTAAPRESDPAPALVDGSSGQTSRIASDENAQPKSETPPEPSRSITAPAPAPLVSAVHTLDLYKAFSRAKVDGEDITQVNQYGQVLELLFPYREGKRTIALWVREVASGIEHPCPPWTTDVLPEKPPILSC